MATQLQYFWLANSMDRGTWQAIIHRVVESDMTKQAHTYLVYNVVLVSDVQQSDSVSHICIYSLRVLLSPWKCKKVSGSFCSLQSP